MADEIWTPKVKNYSFRRELYIEIIYFICILSKKPK